MIWYYLTKLLTRTCQFSKLCLSWEFLERDAYGKLEFFVDEPTFNCWFLSSNFGLVWWRLLNHFKLARYLWSFQQTKMSSEKNCVSKLEKQKDCKVYNLLDLPEWTLDCILECLSPMDLFRVAQVCTNLRDKTRNDALWEKLIKQKWGRLLGDAAYHEWQWHTTKFANTQSIFSLQHNQTGSCGSFSGVWPFLNFHSYLENFTDFITLFKNCSKMALYICLESGRFWFPVQLYKVNLTDNNLYIYIYITLLQEVKTKWS